MKIRANTTFYSIVLCRLDIEGFRVMISRFFFYQHHYHHQHHQRNTFGWSHRTSKYKNKTAKQQPHHLSIFGIRLFKDAGRMIELNIFDFSSSWFFKWYLTTETDAKHQNGKMALRRVGWHHTRANHFDAFQTATATVDAQWRRLKRFICELCKSKAKTISWICVWISVLFFSFFPSVQVSFFDYLFLLQFFWALERGLTSVSFLLLKREKKIQNIHSHLFEQSVSLSLLHTVYEKWLNTAIRFIGFCVFLRHGYGQIMCIDINILVDTIIAPAAII